MRRVQAIVVIALGAMIAGCAGEQSKPGGSGLLEATEIIVSAQTAGQVTVLNFDEGTDVKTGDTMLVIDPTQTQLQLEAASAGREVAVAQLSAARLDLKRAQETEQYAATELARVERLVKSSTATQKQLDDITHQHTTATIAVGSAKAAIATGEAQIKKIDADIARLQQTLDYSYPTAPGTGVVTEKYTDFGNLLSPGRPIAKISQVDSVWVKVYLPMKDFAEVKLGEPATVNTEAGDVYNGIVTWTADQAEFTPKNVQTKKARADLVYAVKVKMANADRKLKVGQPVFVTIGQ